MTAEQLRSPEEALRAAVTQTVTAVRRSAAIVAAGAPAPDAFVALLWELHTAVTKQPLGLGFGSTIKLHP